MDEKLPCLYLPNGNSDGFYIIPNNMKYVIYNKSYNIKYTFVY